MLNVKIDQLNTELRHKTPEEIVDWALALTDKRIVTTSFGIYSAVLLSTFHKQDKGINVVWCDTGFNTPETYKHADYLIKKFNLNINIYSPLNNRKYINSFLSAPTVDTPEHNKFSEIVKLEPFRRALSEHKPKLWFTNIRVRQTRHRDSKDILSYSKDGILKVSPFYHWSDEELDGFLMENNLPKNTNYFDPTKVLSHRECGLHLQ